LIDLDSDSTIGDITLVEDAQAEKLLELEAVVLEEEVSILSGSLDRVRFVADLIQVDILSNLLAEKFNVSSEAEKRIDKLVSRFIFPSSTKA
jgi:hypothetical protein